MGDAAEQDHARCAVVNWPAIMEARVAQIKVSLQVRSEQTAARSIYTLQSGEKGLVTSKDCPRNRLPSDFKNGPWKKNKNNRRLDAGIEDEAARYFLRVSASTKKLLQIGEGSYRIVRLVFQKQVRELGRVIVKRMVTMAPYSMALASEDTLHTCPGWNDEVWRACMRRTS